MEPASGRSSDYWDNPFVFDIAPDGKIKTNPSLNEKMGDAKPRPATIKTIKKYLSKIKK